MRAMILAAGRGNRLRPLTDTIPKPLVPIRGKPLIAYHLENLQRAGVTEVVINVCHLGEKIQHYCGDGARFGVSIHYSVEPLALDSGGGICNALSHLGDAPFMLVNGDIWTDYDLSDLPETIAGLVHLVLVSNPVWHPNGDFALKQGKLCRAQRQPYTYTGIAVLHPALFANNTPGSTFSLVPLLDKAILEDKATGEHYEGLWTDVGTLDRLQHLEHSL